MVYPEEISPSEIRWIYLRNSVNDTESVRLFRESFLRTLNETEKAKLVTNVIRFPTMGRVIIPEA